MRLGTFWTPVKHATFLVALSCAWGAHAQISVGDDIPWEGQFTTLVGMIPADPVTFDANANGKPDAWEYTLAEQILTNINAPAHRQRLLDVYNANYDTLAIEAPGWISAAHYLTLAISRGDILVVESELGIALTDSLYTVIREIADAGDPDGDSIVNVDESGTDAASYTTAATTNPRTFKLGTEVELLNAAFYNGGQRMAFWGQLNNAGTTVAFHGVELPSFTTEIYLVDLGDPSSWRKLTTGFGSIPQSGVSWSPDDSRIFIGNRRIDVATGAVSVPLYLGQNLVDAVITAKPDDNYILTIGRPVVTLIAEYDFLRIFDASLLGVDGAGGALTYEWNSDGDTEGWSPIEQITGVNVAGGYLIPETTGNDPYLHRINVSVDAATNPYIAVRLRQNFNSWARIYWTTSLSPDWGEDKTVDFIPARAGEFQTIVLDMSSHPLWAGTITNLRLDPHGLTEPNIRAIPVHPNGNVDTSRDAVFVTNFDRSTLNGSLDWVAVAPDFSAFAVADYAQSSTPGVADPSNLMVVRDLPAILSAPTIPNSNISTLAPRSPELDAAAPLRYSPNFGQAPSFSQDASVVLYVEDSANLFRNADFFGSLLVADLDVGVSPARGNSQGFILNKPGNQSIPTATRGGTRVIYVRDIANPFDLRLFATSLESETLLNGTIDGGGQLVTTATETAKDPAGTTITLPPATTITFPPGVLEPNIAIETPLSPVSSAQLPTPAPGEPLINGIPVVRTFGPSGTTFSPSIPVTITYTDKEIEGLIESELRVFLFNTVSGVFDIEIPDAVDAPAAPKRIINRDLANNTITFVTNSFSNFGIGAELDPSFDGDGDGMPDAWEIENGLDPNNPADAGSDADNDGLSNVEEYLAGTDAGNPDSDGDGLPDGWEVANGFDPLDDGSIDVNNGPSGDPDGDGFTNLEEYLGDSDPQDTDSSPVPMPLGPISLVVIALAAAGVVKLRRS